MLLLASKIQDITNFIFWVGCFVFWWNQFEIYSLNLPEVSKVLGYLPSGWLCSALKKLFICFLAQPHFLIRGISRFPLPSHSSFANIPRTLSFSHRFKSFGIILFPWHLSAALSLASIQQLPIHKIIINTYLFKITFEFRHHFLLCYFPCWCCFLFLFCRAS